MKEPPVEADDKERTFRNVIESIPIGIHMYQLESDGRLVFTGANPAADALLGLKNEQFIGKTIEEAFPGLAGTELPGIYRRAAADGASWYSDQIEYADEKIRGAFEVHAFQTSPGKMVAAFMNITQRKQTEEALQTSLITIKEEKEKLETILASIGVGISILDTGFRVLYQNQIHKNFIGDHLGEYCYRGYENRAGICEGCPLAISFQDGGVHTRERQVIISGRTRYFEITTSVLKNHQEEIIAGIEVVREITIRKLMEASLRYRIAFEKLIMEISTNFITLPSDSMDSGIDSALRDIGEFTGVDRSYVFLFYENGTLMDNTHEWCAPGIEPQMQQVRNVIVDEAFPWFSREIKNREIFYLPSVADLPPEAAAERKEFGRQEIQSMICVPMLFADSLIGFIGFDSVRTKKAWPEDTIFLLKIISEIFANALARKQAEDALLRSEKRYQHMFDTTTVSIWEEDYSGVKTALDELKAAGIEDIRSYLDEHPEFMQQAAKLTRIVDVNDATLQIYGAKSKEELMVSLDKIFTAESYTAVKEFLIAIAEGRTHFEAESMNKTLQGEELIVLIHIAIPSERSGFQNLLVSIIDITERRHAEAARRESEDRYRDLFENANDAIFIVDADLNYIDANKKAVELFGFSREEILRMNILDVIPSEQVSRSEKVLRKLRGKESYDKFVGKMKRKDGRWLDIEVSSSPIIKNGAVVGSRDIVRDITERKKLEEELMKREKLESLGVLTGGLAHDFNNLLTAILGNISLAGIPGQTSEAILARLTDAEKAALRARDLTQQLLTFSKGGAPVKQMLNIGAIIKDSAAFSLSGSSVKCIYEMPKDLWSVEADAGQMSQVINNLVINADQAMPGGGTITITGENVILEAENRFSLKEGNYVKIAIKDQGMGIPREHLRKIFDPYFTTKQKGSGLGLASAFSVVRRHDGYIAVESILGSGTTFSLYLPASVKDLSGEKERGEDQLAGKGKILVMDDEESVRKVAGEILKTLGYEVEHAGDGREALAIYRKAKESAVPFDAVIMDLTIPGGMGGREAVGELLRIDPGAKVIVSSGYSQDPVMANFRDYGFAGVISKPYRVSELGKKLHEVLTTEGRAATGE